MPLFVCQINLFLKRTIITQLMLFLDGIMISRFMFVFVYKNPSAFQDDFWSFFVNIWILSFSWIGQIVSEVFLGCNNLGTNICSGKNIFISTECLQVTKNDLFNGIIAIFSILIHIFVLIKIQVFKWKNPAEQLHISPTTKISWRNFRESNFFSNFIQNTITSMLLISTAVGPGIIKMLTFHDNQANWFDILNRLVRVPLTLLLLIANYCYFHRSIFLKILQAVMDWLNKITHKDFFSSFS